MRPRLRAAVECPDGVVRITILCGGCAADLLGTAQDENRNWWVREAAGVGPCEFCDGEILAEFGA